MKLRIKTFGIVSEIVDGKTLEIDPLGSRVGDLRKTLMERFPELVNLNSLMIAVNSSYAEDSLELHESDEIALIPPVSGG